MKKLMIAAGCAVLVGAVMADGTGPDEEMRTLGEQATNAMTRAYAPYSNDVTVATINEFYTPYAQGEQGFFIVAPQGK